MSDFRINILGCGSATPSLRHLPSCQVIEYRQRLMMIDCGEGAQLSMRRQRLKFSRLTDVFISHLHGDHFLGLPGLLSTLALHEKTGTVTIHIFKEGADLLRQILDMVCRDPSYEIKYNIIDPKGGVVYDDHAITVEAFPLFHRVPAVGFKFVEKPKPRHLRGDMVKFFNVPVHRLNSIKMGADFVTEDGRVIENSRLTTDPTPSLSYAYCCDTAYNPAVAESVRGIDVIYHDATYADDRAGSAAKRGHATAREAARIAREAGAKQLILGHFSKSYLNEDAHLAEALEEFPNVIIANEGLTIDLI